MPHEKIREVTALYEVARQAVKLHEMVEASIRAIAARFDDTIKTNFEKVIAKHRAEMDAVIAEYRRPDFFPDRRRAAVIRLPKRATCRHCSLLTGPTR